MTKVLTKLFDILEAVIVRYPQPVRTGELAKMHGIHVATCSRILQELLELGYLQKSRSGAGFVVGPRLIALKSRVNYNSTVLQMMNEVVERCAHQCKGRVLFSQRFGLDRYILSFCNEIGRAHV